MVLPSLRLRMDVNHLFSWIRKVRETNRGVHDFDEMRLFGF